MGGKLPYEPMLTDTLGTPTVFDHNTPSKSIMNKLYYPIQMLDSLTLKLYPKNPHIPRDNFLTTDQLNTQFNTIIPDREWNRLKRAITETGHYEVLPV